MEKEMPKNPFIELTDVLLTKAETDHFIELIGLLSESLFSKKTDVNEKIEELFPTHLRTIFIKILKKNNIDLSNSIELLHFIHKTKDYLEEVPIVNLIFAFTPKQQTVSRIYTWFNFQLKKPILLDITVNKSIIGGAIIDFEGVHFEYTIHKVLNETLKNNRPTLSTKNG